MLRNKHQEDWNPGSDPSSDPGSNAGFIISLSQLDPTKRKLDSTKRKLDSTKRKLYSTKSNHRDSAKRMANF